MKRLRLLSIVLSIFPNLIACVTYPASTGFVPAASKDDYGYTITEYKPGSYVAIYRGNEVTKIESAKSYAMLAAYQHCEKQQALGYVLPAEDISSIERSTGISSYSLPNFNPGGVTTYSTHVYSYPIKTVYPNFWSSFSCRKHFKNFEHNAEFENIGRELVHNVTKDFRGGLLVKSVRVEDSGKPFLMNDVLIKLDKSRVEDLHDLAAAFERVQTKQTTVEVIRNQKVTKLSAQILDLNGAVKEIEIKTVQALCREVPLTEYENDGGELREVPAPNSCRALK